MSSSACVECTIEFPESDMVKYGQSYICADCKPIFFQKLKEGGEVSTHSKFAGFWLRVAATIIDSIIIVVIYYAALMVLGLGMFGLGSNLNINDPASADEGLAMGMMFVFVYLFCNFVLPALYECIMVHKWGATVGKMACGIKVVNADESKLSVGKSIGRHFAKYLNAFTLGLAYIIVGVDDEKRGIHDMICGTRVVPK